jgi:hypothetical protein
LNGASMDSSAVKFTRLNGKIIMEANFIPNQLFSHYLTKDPSDEISFFGFRLPTIIGSKIFRSCFIVGGF